MSLFGRHLGKLGDLPDSHADEVTQPCDWCGQSIPHEHPPAEILLNVQGRWLETRRWRVCEPCLEALIALVKTRVDGVA